MSTFLMVVMLIVTLFTNLAAMFLQRVPENFGKNKKDVFTVVENSKAFSRNIALNVVSLKITDFCSKNWSNRS